MLQPLKISKKTDNDAKLAQIIKENIPTTEYIPAEEFNAIVGKINEMVPAINVSNGGFQGTLSINEKRVDSGFYIPTESGTFINADNVVVDLSQGINFVSYDGDKWEVALVPIVASGKIEEGDERSVSGNLVKTTLDFFSKEYAIANDVEILFDQGSRIITFNKNPLIYNVKSGHRVYLFPLRTSYPKTLEIPVNSTLYVLESKFMSIGIAGSFENEDLVFENYGKSLKGSIPLIGYQSQTGWNIGILRENEKLNKLKNEITLKIDKNNNLTEGYTWSQGFIHPQTGLLVLNENRIASSFIKTSFLETIKIDRNYLAVVTYYDINKNLIKNDGVFRGTFDYPLVDGTYFIRLSVRKGDGSIITPNEDTKIKIYTSGIISKQVVEDLSVQKLMQQGESGTVLTPDGWSSDFVKSIDVVDIVKDSGQFANIMDVSDIISSSVEGLATENYVLQQSNNYLKKTEEVRFVKDNIITPDKLSQTTMDLINSSGGGTITNMPDDVDLTVNSQNKIELKGGGVVRFRLKSNPEENYNELVRCMSFSLPIEISNRVDLSTIDEKIRDITFNGTFIFVGDGEIANCNIIGNVEVVSNRKKIFDNVNFHKWSLNGKLADNSNSIYLTSVNKCPLDIYNYKTKSFISSFSNTFANMLDCYLMVSKIGQLIEPLLVSGKYVYQENGKTLLDFKVIDGKIEIPIRKDYLFQDLDGNILESTFNINDFSKNHIYIEPSNLRISRLVTPVLNRIGSIRGEVYPEWFGAMADKESFDNKYNFQQLHLLGGAISLTPKSIYYTSGGVTIFGDVIIKGNGASSKMIQNSVERYMYQINTKGLSENIIIYDYSLIGSINNIIKQDGIFADARNGLYDGIKGYSFDNTYWYNLRVSGFSRNGINCAVPGTSHIYSSYVSGNGQDGFLWWMEHFTLTNCTAWGNGRHGVFTGGNHWRIIGGAYAHSGAGSNIHCVGATVSQVIGCSVIHSGVFLPKMGGGYSESSLNVYGYIYVGEGLGTHEMVGGDGVYLENCSNMTFESVRVSGANANSYNVIGNSNKISISNGIFEGHNLVRKDYKNLNGSAKDKVRIINTELEGQYISFNTNELLFFGTSTYRADWNNLKGTFSEFKSGVFHIRDSYNALNRPSGVTGNLVGTIKVMPVTNFSIMRVFVDVSDELGNLYKRFFNVTTATGEYSNDTGWRDI